MAASHYLPWPVEEAIMKVALIDYTGAGTPLP